MQNVLTTSGNRCSGNVRDLRPTLRALAVPMKMLVGSSSFVYYRSLVVSNILLAVVCSFRHSQGRLSHIDVEENSKNGG